LPARWGRRPRDAEGAAPAYTHGVSTRSVDALAEALGLKGISKDQVSRQLRRELLRISIGSALTRPRQTCGCCATASGQQQLLLTAVAGSSAALTDSTLARSTGLEHDDAAEGVVPLLPAT